MRVRYAPPKTVMPGLDPGIHGATGDVGRREEGVDSRDKPGHDDSRLSLSTTLFSPIEEEMAVPTGSAGAAIPVSALTGEGIDALLAALRERVAETYRIEAPVLTRARHREALEEAAARCTAPLAATLPELRAEDLRLALRSLGRITGTRRRRGLARRDLRATSASGNNRRFVPTRHECWPMYTNRDTGSPRICSASVSLIHRRRVQWGKV